jgi:hypothetical protein
MSALINLRDVEDVAQAAEHYGAYSTASRIRAASALFGQQSLEAFDLDMVLRLLDPSLLWQEIKVATRDRGERWYIARNVSTVLLLIVTFFLLYLAATTYLGWWPSWHISPLILSLSALIDFALFCFWSFCIGRIQWSKFRAKRNHAHLAFMLRAITRDFLLEGASIISKSQPRDIEHELRYVTDELQRAARQLADTSQQAFQQLATKNEQALQQLVATNQDVLGKMQTLNAEVERQVHLFDTTPSLDNLRKDIAAFLAGVGDYQGRLIQANSELNSAVGHLDTVVKNVAYNNKGHIDIEQRLTAQFEALKNVQQAAIDRTETIATAMSTTAQSVVNIVDRLAHQQLDSSGTGQKVPPRGSSGELETKLDFDVFLSYSSEDRSAVRRIAEQLKARGILPWLNELELPPGTSWQSVLEEQIPHIGSVAVFIGNGDTAPWKNKEMRAILREFVKRNKPVIPVLLPECDEVAPELPAFLEGNIWVDFRQKDPDPLETLSWGITGRRVTS